MATNIVGLVLYWMRDNFFFGIHSLDKWLIKSLFCAKNWGCSFEKKKKKEKKFLPSASWHSSSKVSKCESNPTFTWQAWPAEEWVKELGVVLLSINSVVSPAHNAAKGIAGMGAHKDGYCVSKNSHFWGEYVKSYVILDVQILKAINDKMRRGIARSNTTWFKSNMNMIRALGWEQPCTCSKAWVVLSPSRVTGVPLPILERWG